MKPLRLGYLNAVYLTGRLVADPELRYTQKGAPVCDFRIACSRRFKNRETGEWQEETLFINIVAWQRQAEAANDYLKKGSAVLIDGNLRSRQWETSQGDKRSAIEVVARRIQFLDLPPKEEEVTDTEVPAETGNEAKDVGDIETPF
ncbi:MAG: single-stranded DNA-binding protein [Candidatus Stahlbacteria bacterium]|jgi:single-strand DNA-binding protein|nr:single-stranded DNA-binding protein [candidate division WOR-3 bacterium]MCK4673854.1 single-stranded DNA-binding protein [candidate division WOR-3 bacterium]TET63618.1 MAG: single-stranded DNA-binding protein [Candidatus Stahlbacteria bacterium]